MELNILYEDNHIIVCYKPKGVLSQQDNTNTPDMLTLLKDYIKIKYNKPGEVFLGLVHRLDRNTDGIMVFARTSKAAKRLSDDIKNNLFHKTYLAIVEGIINNADTLKDMMYFDENKKKSFIKNDSKSKEAILLYDVLGHFDNKTLLSVNLITGRHHQIRCQLAHIGHPIVGDIKYGSKIKMGNYYMLSAYKLKFIHPTKKEEMEFEYIDDNSIYNNFK